MRCAVIPSKQDDFIIGYILFKVDQAANGADRALHVHEFVWLKAVALYELLHFVKHFAGTQCLTKIYLHNVRAHTFSELLKCTAACGGARAQRDERQRLYRVVNAKRFFLDTFLPLHNKSYAALHTIGRATASAASGTSAAATAMSDSSSSLLLPSAANNGIAILLGFNINSNEGSNQHSTKFTILAQVKKK